MEIIIANYCNEGDTLIHGCAKGADLLAEQAWANLKIEGYVERFPADWVKHGKAAGPIRNKQMLDEGKPDLVIAFLAKDSRGTKNMIEQAEKAGVDVKIVDISEEEIKPYTVPKKAWAKIQEIENLEQFRNKNINNETSDKDS